MQNQDQTACSEAAVHPQCPRGHCLRTEQAQFRRRTSSKFDACPPSRCTAPYRAPTVPKGSRAASALVSLRRTNPVAGAKFLAKRFLGAQFQLPSQRDESKGPLCGLNGFRCPPHTACCLPAPCLADG